MHSLIPSRLYSGQQATDDLTVELFGYTFTSQLALQDDMDRLFYTARYKEGGHGTGKTWNLVIIFFRLGKHRKFKEF